jgi:photosystem II stability/assembly factor-like uncharacterized protein
VAALQSIIVTPINFTLSLGLDHQYTATGHYTDLSTQDITDAVSWASTDTDLATVTNTTVVPVPDVVLNGTFEGGTLTNWNITTGTLALPQYTTGDPLFLGGDNSDPSLYLSNVSVINTDANTGTHSMMIGSSANGPEDLGYNEVTQTITVPAVGVPALSFWVKFFNPDDDSTYFDFQQALIVSTVDGHTLIDLFSSIETPVVGDTQTYTPPMVDLNTQVWTNFTIDISSLAGQTVKILFRNRGDGSSDPTWFLVDDVKTTTFLQPKGIVTANSYDGGLLDITATSGLIVGSTGLTIIPNLTSIVVTKDTPVGNTVQLTATGHYDDASTLDLTSVATWQSSIIGVATVDSSGLVTVASSAGTTNVSATFHAHSGSIPIVTISAWGDESSVVATELGGFALTSSNLFVNNSYDTPSKVIKSTGGGTWTDTSLGLGSSPGNTQGVWGTGSLVLIGGQAGSTANAIIKSTNAGSTWATVSNSFTSQVWFIHGSSASNIWAAGGSNILLKSTDSGSTWSSISFPGGFLEGIHVISTTDMWIGGGNTSFTAGVLYHYNGTTFTSFYANLGATVIINSIWASSTTDIYVAASSLDYTIKYIYHSTNSGTTFTLERKIFDSIAHDRPKVFGTSSTEVYFGTSPTQLLHTNGSGTWTRETAKLPNGNGTIPGTISTILGTDSSHMWAGGSATTSFIIKKDKVVIFSPALVSISVTGAATISTTAQYRATGTYDDGRQIDLTSDVTWSSTNTGVATISNTISTIGIATNAGPGFTNITATLGLISGFESVAGSCIQTWTQQLTSANVGGGGAQVWTVWGLNDTHVYAGVDNGRIYYSNNSGTSWTQATVTGGTGGFYHASIWGTSTSNLYAIQQTSGSNKIFKSTDGGVTWNPTAGQPTSFLSSAQGITGDPSGTYIWAFGSAGIWRSNDSGSTWVKQAQVTTSIGGAAAYASNFVWAVGNAGRVWTYDGSNWTSHQVGPTSGTGRIDFQTVWLGQLGKFYLSGTGSINSTPIYMTADQGATFIEQTTIPDNPGTYFFHIDGVNTAEVWAVGLGGKLFVSYDDGYWYDRSSLLTGNSGSDLMGVWVSPTNKVFVSGTRGVYFTSQQPCVAPTISSFTITPSSASLNSGGTQNFTANATFSDATTGTITSSVTWASSNTSVLTMSNTGLTVGVPGRATALAGPGSSIVSAVAPGSVASSNTVTVPVSLVFSSIVVAPASATVAPSSTQQYVAYGVYSGGSIDATNTVSWNSTSTAAATIVNSGAKTTVLYSSFEDGYSGWTLTGGTNTGTATSRSKISTTSLGLSGWNSTSFPSEGSQTARLSRSVAIPGSGNTTLAFWYDLEDTSNGVGTAITHVAEIKNAADSSVLLTIFNIGETYAATNFVSKVVDLTPYAGTTVTLSFRVDAANGTSSNANANMYLDGIVVVNGAASSKGLVNTVAVGSTTIQAIFGVTGSTPLTVAFPPPPLLTFSSVSAPTNFWYAMWGSSTTDIYASALDGTIAHSTGGAFSAQTSGTANALVAIWGAGGSVYAVGDSRTVRKTTNNGTTWTGVGTLPSTLYGSDCKAVWGSSATDFWVSQEFSLQHTTDGGTTWENSANGGYSSSGAGNFFIPATNSIYGLFGFAANDIYASGRTGRIMHWNGTSWTDVISGDGSIYYSIWGRSGTDIYVMADSGAIYHSTNGFSSKTQLTNPASFTNFQGNIFGNASYMLGGGSDHETDINLHNPAVYQEPGGFGNTLTATRVVQVSNNGNPAVFSVWMDSSTNTAYVAVYDGAGNHYIYKGV